DALPKKSIGCRFHGFVVEVQNGHTLLGLCETSVGDHNNQKKCTKPFAHFYLPLTCERTPLSYAVNRLTTVLNLRTKFMAISYLSEFRFSQGFMVSAFDPNPVRGPLLSRSRT